jgi:hypothetical protein
LRGRRAGRLEELRLHGNFEGDEFRSLEFIDAQLAAYKAFLESTD